MVLKDFSVPVLAFLFMTDFIDTPFSMNVKGPAAAGHLLSGCRGEVLQERTEAAAHIRKSVFGSFFTLLHTGRLTVMLVG